ncbi:MAG TPA: hypothetical protein DCF92_08010, partial [Idiomarina sp.]|nr:hypothetical protein [Idiomarina sp.]
MDIELAKRNGKINLSLAGIKNPKIRTECKNNHASAELISRSGHRCAGTGQVTKSGKNITPTLS